MPEQRREAAARDIEREIISRIQGARRLTIPELAAHGSQFRLGWELPELLASGRHQLRLLLDDRFPFARPRAAIFPPEPVLTWPHLEPRGLLCVTPDEVAHSPDKPVDSVVHLLNDARTLMNDNVEGRGLEQFEIEFVSYWDHHAQVKKILRSLCRPDGPSRKVSAWYGENMTVVADDKCTLRAWLEAFTGGQLKGKEFSPRQIPFIWLATVPRPSQYPLTVGDLLALSRNDATSLSLIDELLASESVKNKYVVFGCRTTRGVGLAVLQILNPAIPRGGGDPLTRGFRGLPPPPILRRRYESARTIGGTVVRSDPAWVHGRDHNPEAVSLLTKSVVILGTGSIGSPVAKLLVQSGVGKLTLIDPETLDSENTGRHELGAVSVTKSKAEELALLLRRHFPHLSIQAEYMTWRQVVQKRPELLSEADLVISTMGNWSGESDLNAFALAQPSFPPILYGWTEPHAAAGHAVVFIDRSACLRCVTDGEGRTRLTVTAWKDETTRPVPACGGAFQPYGAIELGHTNALVAELALDVLLKRISTTSHRVWVGRRSVLERAGGAWNADWVATYGDPGQGGLIVEAMVTADSQCPECKPHP